MVPMETEVAGWTTAEQALAQAVFDRAMAREVESLIGDLHAKIATLSRSDEVWQSPETRGEDRRSESVVLRSWWGVGVYIRSVAYIQH